MNNSVVKNILEGKDIRDSIMEELTQWQSAENYMGEDYSDYYVAYTKHRDSNQIDLSNFDAVLNQLGGEKEPNVIVVEYGHWAVGHVTQILVHKDAAEAVAELENITAALDEYPVLDETDYSEREQKAFMDHIDDWAWSDAISDLGVNEEELTDDQKGALQMALYDMLSQSSADDPYYRKEELEKILKNDYPQFYVTQKYQKGQQKFPGMKDVGTVGEE